MVEIFGSKFIQTETSISCITHNSKEKNSISNESKIILFFGFFWGGSSRKLLCTIAKYGLTIQRDGEVKSIQLSAVCSWDIEV